MSNKTLSEIHAESVKNIVSDYSGLVLTTEQVNAIIESNITLVDDIERWTVYDTVTRESVLNAVSQHIVGESWPLYKDGNNGFWERLVTACAEKGYIINKVD